MGRVDEFDAFYHATRRSLLHQTYALTGDADRAGGAVEGAFAHAWSQWRKVSRLPDPPAWVRGEAWRLAGGLLARRRRGRTRRRGVADPAEGAHAGELEALGDLPDAQRRAVVLHHLAHLPAARIAQELGVSESAAQSLLARGEQGWSDGGTPIHQALADLGRDLAGVRLHRAPSVRRAGERRHRRQTLTGLAAAAALVVGGGLLIVNESPVPLDRAAASPRAAATAAGPATQEAPEPGTGPPADRKDTADTDLPPVPEPFLLDEQALLTAGEMAGLADGGWTVTSTTDGTTGDPIYAPCQREPFADPDGNQAMLRHFASEGGGPPLSAVQVIEESRNERQAKRALATMEGWYARCDDDGIQLLNTRSVTGLGNQARAFQLREVGRTETFHTVGLARTGPITTAVVASTRGPRPVPVARVLDRAAVSVTRTCLPVSGDCTTRSRVREVPPLPTREHPGFLAAYDLPAISNITAPWVGTDPRPSPDNPASTPCERANFRRYQHPRTRVFVLPTAERLPRRFGISETVGTFRSRTDARRFMRQAYASAQSCPDRELSASRPREQELAGAYGGRVWRFEFEVDQQQSVAYRVGLVQGGRRVALVSMSPAQGYDVTQQAFANLLTRAGYRLAEADGSS